MFDNSMLDVISDMQSYTDFITTVEAPVSIIEEYFGVKVNKHHGNIDIIDVDYLGVSIELFVAGYFDDLVELKIVLRNNPNKRTNLFSRISSFEDDLTKHGFLYRIKLIAGLTMLVSLDGSAIFGYYNEGSDIVFGDTIFSYITSDLYRIYPKLKDARKDSLKNTFDYLWFNYPQDITSEDRHIKKIVLEEMTIS